MTAVEFEKWVKFWADTDLTFENSGFTATKWLEHPFKLRSKIHRIATRILRGESV